MVVYPENIWYGNLNPQNINEIVEKHIKNGEIVKHLQIPAEEL